MRFRLWALGLMPLLLAFPVVLTALALLASQKADALLAANLHSHLAGARNYLEQVKSNASSRVSLLVKSERLLELIQADQPRGALERELRNAVRSNGLDYLIVATEDGQIIAASNPVAPGHRLPDSHVTRQARAGMVSAAYERFNPGQLASVALDFPQRARVPLSRPASATATPETPGLLINAAAHFPLEVKAHDAILLGGILLNRNAALIDHLREIIFPMGSLPQDNEGLTAIHTGALSIAASRHRQLKDSQTMGTTTDAEVVEAVLEQGRSWLGRREIGKQTFMIGYEAISNGEGERIGMLSTAIPDAPYQRMTWLLLGLVGGLLALTMLVISTVFLRTGRDLAERLQRMGDTMKAVETGNRQARIGPPPQDDELGQLGRNFDHLLDTIARQDQRQQAVQQALADEATRRRVLFESERDGVVILDPDGRIFEANPRAASLLGYTPQELPGLHASRWYPQWKPDEWRPDLAHCAPAGRLLETVLQRKDGSHYPAELSISPATWGARSFVLLHMRDISERKAAELEMQRLATTDGLTGVLNRRAWSAAAERLLAQARRYRHPLAMLSVDADRFKNVNDTHGHPAGDAVLIALARTLAQELRQSDLLGRMGGEEFAILLPETDTIGLQQMGERLLQAVRDCRVEHGELILSLRISVGGATLNEDGPDTLDTLVTRCDRALYQAKHEGRDRLCLATGLNCPRASCA